MTIRPSGFLLAAGRVTSTSSLAVPSADLICGTNPLSQKRKDFPSTFRDLHLMVGCFAAAAPGDTVTSKEAPSRATTIRAVKRRIQDLRDKERGFGPAKGTRRT